MFCIKSDVITLEYIKMYGFVIVWTSKDDGPYWVILLMYGSHDMRHTGFRRLTVVNGTPGNGASHLPPSSALPELAPAMIIKLHIQHHDVLY